MNKRSVWYWILFFLTFILIWIGLDYVFSALRAAVFVFAKALKTAIYSAVITIIVFNLADYITRRMKK
ncbi:MAG: hypothetical protein K5908_02105 [Erysipelotrichaceae bacterium]|nr:hypothetical protein [Erysipelotrichaceae bacterium]